MKKFISIMLILSSLLSLTIICNATLIEEELIDIPAEDEILPMCWDGCSTLPTNSIIKGWTTHGTDSANTHNNGHGVSDAAILQAVTTTPIWNEPNQTWNYYGTDAVVCLNTAGFVTTCWAITSNGYRN